MTTSEIPSFDELVDLLRRRLRDADVINQSEIHSFKELMSDHAEVIGEDWYWDAFEELEAQGHINPKMSRKGNGGDAFARLSADGRLYLRSSQ